MTSAASQQFFETFPPEVARAILEGDRPPAVGVRRVARPPPRRSGRGGGGGWRPGTLKNVTCTGFTTSGKCPPCRCPPCRCSHRKTTFISCLWPAISSLPYLTYPLPTGGDTETAICASAWKQARWRPAMVHQNLCQNFDTCYHFHTLSSHF